MIRHLIARSTLVASLSIAAAAQNAVHYTVSLADPGHHLVQVTLNIPPGRAMHELQLPVWNALYQVRDFSQYMNWIRAFDTKGNALPLTQLNASRWRIANTGAGAKIEYEIFANDAGPFGAELNQQHAFFNLAEILIYVDDARSATQQVEFANVPTQWKTATALTQAGSVYFASNYDRLVDSPVEISNFTEQDFQGPCGTYRVVLDWPGATDAMNKIVPPIRRIVAAASRWMDDCPFKTYTFIYHFSDSPGGGMEHAYSTAIGLSPRSIEGDLSRFEFTTAHEFFHLWDVKRIRPQSLEPIDYTRENYTPALWFSEGVDSTAADFILLRTGLIDEHHFLTGVGDAITELQAEPARLTQSVEQSSLDAWLEKYPYYGTPDRSISYYNKGDLLGVLLDLRLRESTHDHASLQTLFRWMNNHYAKQGKFFADSAGVEDAAEEISGTDLHQFFVDYVSGTREIPWDAFFAYVGLQVRSKEEVSVHRGFDAVQKFDQPPVVVRVQPGSAADQAGLRADDVILKINGNSAGRDFEKVIREIGVGGTLRLTVSRDGAQREIQFSLGERRQEVFHLEDMPGITPEQRQHRHEWLFAEASTGPVGGSKSPGLP